MHENQIKTKAKLSKFNFWRLETISVQRMRLECLVMVLVWSIMALLPIVVANDENGCSIYTNGVCLPKGYNKHMLPSENTMTVNISVRLEQILAIYDDMSEIDFVIILGISWKEHRFSYSNDTDTRQQSTSIPLNIHWVDYMWTPDLYIYQMRAVSTPELLHHPYTGVRK